MGYQLDRMNITLLKEYCEQLAEQGDVFVNSSKRSFENGYLMGCSDPYISRLKEKLEVKYQKVERDYQNILTWWRSYNENLESLEQKLAKNGGSFTETLISGYVDQKLASIELKEYRPSFANMQFTASPVSATEVLDFVGNPSAWVAQGSAILSKTGLDVAIDKVKGGVIDFFGKPEKSVLEVEVPHTGGSENQEVSAEVATLVGGVTSSLTKDLFHSQTLKVQEKADSKKSGNSIRDNVISSISGITASVAVGSSKVANVFQAAGEKAISKKEEVLKNVEEKFNTAKERVGATIDSVSEHAMDFGNKVKETYNEIESDLRQTAATIASNVGSLWDAGSKWVMEEGVPFVTEAASFVWDALQSVGATIGVVVQSVAKGVLHIGEAVVDTLFLVGSVLDTVILAIPDLFLLVTGGDPHFISNLWKSTMAFVSDKKVDNLFVSFYDNNAIGNWFRDFSWLKTNGTVVNIIDGIGYVAGIVVISFFTAGAGGVAAGASSGATTATTTSVSTIATAISGGAGIGKGAERAWADGASAGEGIVYGVANGAWEGFQFWLGGKINLFGKGATSASSSAAANILAKGSKSGFLNGVARVTMDGVDGGAEGFVQPLMSMIYKDGSYSELFQENGGWLAVGTNAAVGSVASFISEGFDLAMGTTGKKNIDSNIESLDREIVEELKQSDSTEKGSLSDYTNKRNLGDYLEELKEQHPEFESVKTIAELGEEATNYLSKEINNLLSKKSLSSIPDVLLGIVTSPLGLISKFKYNSVLENADLCNVIESNGLYHITDIEGANRILDSGYLKSSDYISSYGNKKSFFFAGVPELDDVAVNLSGFSPKRVAVKFDIDSSKLGDFRYRKYSDMAITYDGNYYFDNGNASLAYLGLFNENGKLTYKEISKAEYDNFKTDVSLGKVNDTINNCKNMAIGMAREYDYCKRRISILKETFADTNIVKTAANFGEKVHSLVSTFKGAESKTGARMTDLDSVETRVRTFLSSNMEESVNSMDSLKSNIDQVSSVKQDVFKKGKEVAPSSVGARAFFDPLEKIDATPSSILDHEGFVVDLGLDITLEVIPIKTLDSILMDDSMYLKFKHFEEYPDVFGDISKNQYLVGLQQYVKALQKENFQINPIALRRLQEIKEINFDPVNFFIDQMKSESPYFRSTTGDKAVLIPIAKLEGILFNKNLQERFMNYKDNSTFFGDFSKKEYVSALGQFADRLASKGAIFDATTKKNISLLRSLNDVESYLNRLLDQDVKFSQNNNYDIDDIIIRDVVTDRDVSILFDIDKILNEPTSFNHFIDFLNDHSVSRNIDPQDYIRKIIDIGNIMKKNGYHFSNSALERYNSIKKIYEPDLTKIFHRNSIKIKTELNQAAKELPLERLKDILYNEKTYQKFMDFNQNRSEFGDTSQKEYLLGLAKLVGELKNNQIPLPEAVVKRSDFLQKWGLNIININDTYLKQFESYGADQGIVRKIKVQDPARYQSLIHQVQEYFPGMNKQTADQFLSGIDTFGVCSYATVLNEIYTTFQLNEAHFKKCFGFDMYQEIDGKKVFNDAEFLVDVYATINKENSALVKKTGLLGKKWKIVGTDVQAGSLSTAYQKQVDRINQYFVSKGINGQIDTKELFSNFYAFHNGYQGEIPITVLENLRDDISASLLEGRKIELDIFRLKDQPDRAFTFYGKDSNTCSNSWHEGSGHSVMVTGLDENLDLIVSSWGREYKLKFDEIKRTALTFFSNLYH